MIVALCTSSYFLVQFYHTNLFQIMFLCSKDFISKGASRLIIFKASYRSSRRISDVVLYKQTEKLVVNERPSTKMKNVAPDIKRRNEQ